MASISSAKRKVQSLPKVNVRDFGEADLETVMRIEEASFRRPYSRQIILNLAQHCPRLFVVAEDADQSVLGYGIASADGFDGHILSIAVHPDRRSAGIGGELLAELETRMSTLGVHSVRLEARISDYPVRRFYERRGYRYHDLLARYYEDAVDAAVYVKELS